MSRFNKHCDRWIDISITILSVLGIVMVTSASVNQSGAKNGLGAVGDMLKQILFFVSGLVLTIGFRNIFKTNLLKKRFLFVVYGLILGAMVACRLFFEDINGAYGWIHLFGSFTLQPSEFAKILVMLILAYYMVDVVYAIQVSPNLSFERKTEMLKRKKMKCLYEPILACLVIIFVCIFVQKDFGTGAILLGISLVCFFTATNQFYKPYQKRLFTLICTGAVVVILAFPLVLKMFDGYQQGRFASWLNPLIDPTNTSFHQANGLIAFSNGLIGRGLGNSTQKFGYIPEATSDYISAIIFEELGLLGLLLIIVPFTVIIWRMFYYAYRVKDVKAKIILSGIGTYFFLHLFLNLGGVTCLIPLTGIPLLCVSAGGSSTWAAFIAIGIAQALIKQYHKEITTQTH